MIEFVIPFVPLSKKNEMIPVRVRGKTRIVPSSRVQKQEADIRLLASRASSGASLPYWPTEKVRLIIEHWVNNGTVRVIGEGMGAANPRGKTGRGRDVPNLPILIADALQGIFYANDNQIEELMVLRR